MTEFEGLLEEVLKEDANVPAPYGMEQRILGGLRPAARSSFAGYRLLLTAAAAIVAAATAWVLSPVSRKVAPVVVAQGTIRAGGETVVMAGSQRLTAPERPARLVPTRHAPRHRVWRGERVRIDAIEIAPVEIQQIKLTSLSVDKGAKGISKITERGEIQ